MEIKTLLKPGDEIYYIESGVVNKGKVTRITVTAENKTKMNSTTTEVKIVYQIDERASKEESFVGETQQALFDKIKFNEPAKTEKK